MQYTLLGPYWMKSLNKQLFKFGVCIWKHLSPAEIYYELDLTKVEGPKVRPLKSEKFFVWRIMNISEEVFDTTFLTQKELAWSARLGKDSEINGCTTIPSQQYLMLHLNITLYHSQFCIHHQCQNARWSGDIEETKDAK